MARVCGHHLRTRAIDLVLITNSELGYLLLPHLRSTQKCEHALGLLALSFPVVEAVSTQACQWAVAEVVGDLVPTAFETSIPGFASGRRFHSVEVISPAHYWQVRFSPL